MKRILTLGGVTVGVFLAGLVLWVVWASTGRLSEDALVQTKRYDAASPQSPPDTLAVTTYNVGYLSGMTNNEPVVRSDSLLSTNLEQALALLRTADPDISAFQEIDYGAARSGYVQQLDTIARRLGYAAAAQTVNWDERYIPFPYGRPAVHFGRTVSGQAVLSRYPVQDHARRVLARPPQWIGRDAFYLDRLAQIALLDLGGHPLFVVNVHLEAFDQDTREKHAREVRAYYDRLAQTNVPVLLLGDFNSEGIGSATTPASPDSTLHTLLHDTALRAVLSDSVRAAVTPSATYPANAPARTIDHIFYPPSFFRVVNQEIECGAPAPPSDHCAVTASLRLVSAATWPSPETLPPIDTLLTK
ncbi:MAG: endonuclease [Bacteroidetes bacterium SW_9_63_38]|nr:MAG: endonuclease [Bacteroidetes bacterium SW_9_63_38]